MVAVATVLLTVSGVTIVDPEWIEQVFRVDPDAGSGELEYAVPVAVAAMIAFAWVVRFMLAAQASRKRRTSVSED